MAKTKKTDTSMVAMLQHVSMKDFLIVGDTADRVMADMTRYAGVDPVAEGAALEATSRQNLAMTYGYSDHDDGTRKPFVFQDGIAVIPIHGTLINRFNSSWGFVTGYNYIRRMVNLALDDDDVEYIVFDVDSPGGEAAGCFELAREIMASRRVKDSLAIVDSLAASGGIALPVCASAMYAIPSARIGSIGVYRMHVSFEKALKNEGIKVTFAKAGDHKVDGNPYEDLPKAVLDEWTESAGRTWDDFIALVAEARGLSEDEVRATQARIYRADEALDLGLIDAVKTTTEAVAAWMAELADDHPSNDDEEEATMTEKTKPEATSGLTATDKAEIARIAGEAAAQAAGKIVGGFQRAQQIRDYAASRGKAFVALGKTLADNDAISFEDAQAIIDSAAGGKAKAKGKFNRVEEVDEDGDGDEDDDESEDDESEDDDDDGDAEEAAEQARRSRLKAKGGKGKQKVRGQRRGDDVNHFENAMGGSRHPNVGAGNERRRGGGNDEPSDDEVGMSILADAAMGGSSWAKPQSNGKTKH